MLLHMKHTKLSVIVQTRIHRNAYRIALREGAKRDLTAGRFINMLLRHKTALQAALRVIDGIDIEPTKVNDERVR